VDPASPAATTGLSRGDVIQEVNHKPVHSVAEYNQAITSSGKKPVLLLVNHGGRTAFVVVEPTR
jgi:serine protease Do